MHAEPLGTRSELQAQIDLIFPARRWDLSHTSAWACYELDDARLPREIVLMGADEDIVDHVSVYSGPPAIRTLMTALGLNYCYAPESDELRDPFATGALWP